LQWAYLLSLSIYPLPQGNLESMMLKAMLMSQMVSILPLQFHFSLTINKKLDSQLLGNQAAPMLVIPIEARIQFFPTLWSRELPVYIRIFGNSKYNFSLV